MLHTPDLTKARGNSDLAWLAASRTVTLDIQNMTCAVCPIMVKKALEHVSGV